MNDIKKYLEKSITEVLTDKIQIKEEIEFGIPRNPEFGDLSSNIAFKLAKTLKSSPEKIAEEICNKIKIDDNFVEKVSEAGGGFINFSYSQTYLRNIAREILQEGDKYGQCNIGKGKKVNLEFVSANPTGPLNIVSARAAALGDSLKRILNFCRYDVKSEFYVNDVGQQILKLGHSILARYAEIKGIEGVAFPEDGYRGNYIFDIVKDCQLKRDIDWSNISDEDKYFTGSFAVVKNVQYQMGQLNSFGVKFDTWLHESSIRSRNIHINVKNILNQTDYLYEKEGATYFKSTVYSDDEDRVLITSDGRLTYFFSDIAYHQDKYARGFEWLIDIWGPDHHGYIARMKAALKALGHPEELFTVIIAQQVNLIRGGQKVMMSKRAGEMITMDDLIEEVGVDAARFFFLQRTASAHLDFDLDLAVKESEENPVFYVQYAHARICSIEKFAEEQGVVGEPNWELIKEKEEFDLLRKLSQFPEMVEICAKNLDPHRITVYLQELAGVFHSFYQKQRVVTKDRELSLARLCLCKAVRQTLKNGMHLLGVSAPERM